MKIIFCFFLFFDRLSQATPIPQEGAIATPCVFGQLACSLAAVRDCDSQDSLLVFFDANVTQNCKYRAKSNFPRHYQSRCWRRFRSETNCVNRFFEISVRQHFYRKWTQSTRQTTECVEFKGPCAFHESKSRCFFV